MSQLTPVQRAFSLPVLRKSLVIALVVGSLLTAINQGDLILAGGTPPLWKLILTYLVPLCVSTFGAWNMAGAFARERRQYDPSSDTQESCHNA